MPQRPYDKPVSREQKVRTSSGLISLLWMFVGAVIAVMIGLFLYLSPLFDGFKTDVEVNPPVKVEPLPQTDESNDFEFYEVLPTREFQTGESMTGTKSVEPSDDQATTKPDAVVTSEQNDATRPRQDGVPSGQADAVVITEEELTYDGADDDRANGAGGNINITAVNNSYILQIRSYDSPDEADRMRAEVMMSGVDARVIKRVDDGMELYQVISNTMNSKEEALSASRRLSSNGIDSLVVEQRH
ncbi:SPOR domain-containing protein [Moraxella lacunata]|uniref:SPOR domain-containing protein n=1 Tax=Moraxella lacunata TaxID=477 RepID=A0A1V4H3M8_MORLA|nr:SPOR domain-containing protein [Moraxella lacunata]OPH39171.1 SPOR domain-containing protein [Moraxella lacunata]